MHDLLALGKNLGGVLVAVFYVSIILWTYKDSRRRVEDPILIATAVAVSFLPIVGVLVYLLLRPPEYLADVRERELEIRAMERQLGRQERCPACRSQIESDYLTCPVCATKLREACSTCDKPLDPRWVVCPFCETEVPGGRRRFEPPSRPSRSDRERDRDRQPLNPPLRPGRSSGSSTPRRSSERPSSSSERPARRTDSERPSGNRSSSGDRPNRPTDGGGSSDPLAMSRAPMSATATIPAASQPLAPQRPIAPTSSIIDSLITEPFHGN